MSDKQKVFDRIWLQTCGDSMSEWYGEITWCQDKVNDDDVEYVRADSIEALRRERDDFHMNYRMKCDVKTKALHEQLAAMTAERDEYKAQAEHFERTNGLQAELLNEALAKLSALEKK